MFLNPTGWKWDGSVLSTVSRKAQQPASRRSKAASSAAADLEIVVGGATSAALHRICWSDGGGTSPPWLAYGGAAGVVRCTLVP